MKLQVREIEIKEIEVGQNKLCVYCGEILCGNKTKFCNLDCTSNYNKTINPELVEGQKFTKGTSGAISELVICTDLLKKGFSVFRSVSPSCSCDLVVMKDELLCRIEVKSARKRLDGTLTFPTCDETKSDIIALVCRNDIVYIPDIDNWFDKRFR